MEKGLNVLDKPLTLEEVKSNIDGNNYITGIVKIKLSLSIANGINCFFNELSYKLIGNSELINISYKVVGTDSDGDTLFVEVSGNVSAKMLKAKNKEKSLTVRDLCEKHPELHNYDYKWTDNRNYKKLSYMLAELGYKLKDDSVEEGVYGNIKAYYDCEVEMLLYKKLEERKLNGEKFDFSKITCKELCQLWGEENCPDSYIASLYDVDKKEVTKKRKQWDIKTIDFVFEKTVKQMEDMNKLKY